MRKSISRLTLALLSGFLSIHAAAQVPRPAIALAAQTHKPFVPRFARTEQNPEVVWIDSCDKPVYPKASLRNEESGTVVLRLKIAANGAILENVVARSSGFRELDKSAIAGFATCKYRPATINGRAVQSNAQISFIFRLD